MHPTTIKPPALPAASAFADALAVIVGPLLTLLANHLPVLGPITTPIWVRINRARNRVRHLMDRLAAGTWRPRTPRLATPGDRPAKGGPAAAYVPRTHAWIVRKLGWRAVAYMGQLDHLLTTPESQALLAAAPPDAIKSLGRTLRPLCRLLGVTPPAILRSEKPPPPPKPPRARKPRKPRQSRAANYPPRPPAPWGTPPTILIPRRRKSDL